MLFDSHCHISDERFDDCREALINDIRESEVGLCVDVGFDLKSSEDVVRVAAQNDFCYAAVGCHPHAAEEMDEASFERIKELWRSPKVVAIGEIGLDYHYENSAKDAQRYWFRRQIALALELKAPIIIHSREADGETMDILKECGAFSAERVGDFPARPDGSPDARVLIHCFSGSAELARQYEKLGATVSFSGVITYKNSKKAAEAAEIRSIQNILAETDSPYLTPVPFRGQDKKPFYVKYTVEKLAQIKGLSYEETAAATFANACRFYGIEY